MTNKVRQMSCKIGKYSVNFSLDLTMIDGKVWIILILNEIDGKKMALDKAKKHKHNFYIWNALTETVTSAGGKLLRRII